MKKRYRLKKSDEISILVQSRVRISSYLYNLYYSKNHQDFKIAVVCGKKCGSAVVRNYEKRVMRAIIRPKIKQLAGFHIVLVAKTTVVGKKFQEKQNDINYLIYKLLKGNKNNEN